MTKTSAELTNKLTNEHFSLSPVDNHRQANLCGPMDDNLKTIERRLGVEISYRGQQFSVVGQNKNRQAAIKILKNLYLESQIVKGESKNITPDMVQAFYDSARVTTLKSGKPKAKPSIDKSCRVLRLALLYAVEAGWLVKAPLPASDASY